VNYGNIPSCTYCHPEVASIGLTEEQVKAKGVPYKIGKFAFSANGRARTSGETDGFVKIIRDEKYGEILGAHIVGAHATELIHEIVVARENEFTVEEMPVTVAVSYMDEYGREYTALSVVSVAAPTRQPQRRREPAGGSGDQRGACLVLRIGPKVLHHGCLLKTSAACALWTSKKSTHATMYIHRR